MQSHDAIEIRTNFFAITAYSRAIAAQGRGVDSTSNSSRLNRGWPFSIYWLAGSE